MKNLFFLLIVTLLLSACAGNPPAWWNPGNTYSSTGRQTVSEEKQRVHTQPVSEIPPMPTEEKINVQDETYEEMILTPLQDEEVENDSGDTTAQTEDATINEPHAGDSILPAPSVLE